MDDLKFRVWSKEQKSWDNPAILEVWDDSGKLEPYEYIKTGRLDPIYMPVENYIIQQYIGLKDVSGKEIYKGDVIRNQAGRIFVVEYIRKGFEYRELLRTTDGFVIPQKCTVVSIGDEALCQVIGNIFENPELVGPTLTISFARV